MSSNPILAALIKLAPATAPAKPAPSRPASKLVKSTREAPKKATPAKPAAAKKSVPSRSGLAKFAASVGKRMI